MRNYTLLILLVFNWILINAQSICSEKYQDIVLDHLKTDNEEDFLCWIKNDSTVHKALKLNVLSALATASFTTQNFHQAIELQLIQIKLGTTNYLLLENSISRYLRKTDLNTYRYMEEMMEQFYQNYFKENKHLNTALCLQLQTFLRLDQRTKFDAMECTDLAKIDSLWAIANEQDCKMEEWLTTQLKSTGYPGKSLVGIQATDTYILFLHASTCFQMQHIHYIQSAIQQAEVTCNLEFLIDKILYKYCQKSIYGNWLNPETIRINDEQEKAYYLALLGLF